MTTAIVLSGGGARGAYEAGVVAGVVEVLGPRERAPFSVFTGTSVGAINATYLAAHADRPDLNVSGLLDEWRRLELARHLSLDPLRLLASGRVRERLARWREGGDTRFGRSLLDPRALESLVERTIPYERLHDNVRAGVVRALVVAALEISTARTTQFAELAPGATFTPSRDPRRLLRLAAIEAPHVLASAALPLLFPARRVGRHYYCDGGIRFNTPIAPAIRCGADRLVIVSLLYPRTLGAVPDSEEAAGNVAAYPSPIFLLGKVLNALLLDPVRYDLDVMGRLNDLLGALEANVAAEELRRIEEVLSRTRGAPYRKVEALVFAPSEDIGRMAHEHAHGLRARTLSTLLVRRLADLREEIEADLLSFVLFDGEFADRLARLGHGDALARADEIRAFFGAPVDCAHHA
ncbi:MAG: patatin-like phospholipase family protein [Sandaracinaceae bacterium]|nr:patatin-like phospholipase family protein [Sandaracinaceae bacterium]